MTLRRAALAVGQLLIVGIVGWFVVRTLRQQWGELQEKAAAIHPAWGPMLLASIIVMATYVLLVEAWRWNVRALGETLPFGDAAGMWFIANVGRYVGKLLGLGTIAVLAQRGGYSLGATVGGSLAALVLSIVTGFSVAMGMGANVVATLVGNSADGLPIWLLVGLPVVGVVMIGAAPWVLPPLLQWAARALQRPVAVSHRSVRLIWQAAAANGFAWIAYGVAFRLFTVGMLGDAPGGMVEYVAVYAAAYVIGLLSFLPGGIGAREAVLILGLKQLGLDEAASVLVALASRVWLSVLEVLPGALILLGAAVRGRATRPPAPPAVSH